MSTPSCSGCKGAPTLSASFTGLLACPSCKTTYVDPDARHVTLLTGPDRTRVRSAGEIVLSDEFRSRYGLLRVLGAGMMGTVYLANDLSTGSPVAIKFLCEADREALARFAREGRLLTQIRHPNLVAVHEVCELSGHPYIVFEAVMGGTLRDRLASTDRPDLPEAMRLMDDILAGLAACHDHDVAHRDLKPANVLLTEDDHAKIGDLGIAKDLGSHDTHLTATGALVGTPAYMSPEQAAGLPAGKEADIYAAGVILYEMLAGRLPFKSSSLLELLRLHREGDAPGIGEFAPEVPAGVARALAAALSRSIASRPASAREFARALHEGMNGGPGHALGEPLAHRLPGPPSGEPTDDALMEAIGKRDTAAFEALILRHQERVWRMAMHFLGDRDEAKDIAQTTFARIFSSAPGYSPRGSFLAYLQCIVSRLCLDLAQKKKPMLRNDLDNLEGSQTEISSLLQARETSATLQAGLLRLPANQRMAVVLRYFGDASYSQIATALGVSEKAVDGLLDRARKRLLAMLGPVLGT